MSLKMMGYLFLHHFFLNFVARRGESVNIIIEDNS